MRNNSISPILKWAGGKRQLLPEIINNLPPDAAAGECRYYEPFIGGGAVLFHLQPKSAVINDTNEELINLYRVIRNSPNALIEDLKLHRNESEYFYRVRGIDRDPAAFSELSDVQRASRIVFMNKTCYNGLYRVNNKGQFNAPFGRYKNPDIVNEHKIREISRYLNSAEVKILNSDFESSLEGIIPGAFVYFDPPYDPVSASANFTTYAKKGFDRDEQRRLKAVCDRLERAGVRFLLSNSATDFIRDLYKEYHVTMVTARRSVNSKADLRGDVEEVLVSNYN